jgi:hypothetical protein
VAGLHGRGGRPAAELAGFRPGQSAEAREARGAGKGGTLIALDTAAVDLLPYPAQTSAKISQCWRHWCRCAKQVGGFEAAQRVLTDLCGARSAGAEDAGVAAAAKRGRAQGRPAPALLPWQDGSYLESAPVEAARSPSLRSTWQDSSYPERAVGEPGRPGSASEQYRKDSENAGAQSPGLRGIGNELVQCQEQEVEQEALLDAQVQQLQGLQGPAAERLGDWGPAHRGEAPPRASLHVERARGGAASPGGAPGDDAAQPCLAELGAV